MFLPRKFAMLPVPSTTPYFHTESLKQRFNQNVLTALGAGHIDAAEARWLQTLVTPPVADQGWISPRLDRITKTGGLPTTFELDAAVQISYRSSYAVVYLDTPLYGLERFNDRQELIQTLLERFGSKTDEVPAFEDAIIDQPLFESRMLSIIDFQVKKLDELATQIQQIPTLHAVFSSVLQQQCDAALPGLTIDWSSHSLQLLQSSGTSNPTRSVTAVQSLLEAGFDDYSGLALAQGMTRQFLDPFGKPLDQAGSQSFQHAISSVNSGLPTAYETKLGNYWWSPVGQGQTRREYFADAFAEGFRQTLYARRNDGFLVANDFRRISALFDSRLERFGEGGQLQLRALTLTNGSQQRSTLAGVFVVESVVPSLRELLIYSAEKGLRRFNNRLELNDYFATRGGVVELQGYLALSDHGLLSSSQPWELQYDPIEGPLFLNCIDSIMALQTSNVLFALKQPKPRQNQIAVMIDDALDIRYLIDRRLGYLEGHDRWPAAQGAFAENWLKASLTPAASVTDVGSDLHATSQSSSWSQLIQTLDDDVAHMWQAHPGAEMCARQLLNKVLAVLGEGYLDTKDVRVYLTDATLDPPNIDTIDLTTESIDLVTLLVQRFSGFNTVAVTAQSQILITPRVSQPADNVIRLTPELIKYVLDQAQSAFSAALINQTRKFYTSRLRRGDTQIFPKLTSSDARAVLLRIEQDLAGRLIDADLRTYEALELALNFPASGLQSALGNSAVQIHSVWLTLEPGSPAVEMSNVFMLCQPLVPNSKVLFWTPLRGIEAANNRTDFEQQMVARLYSSRQGERWLDVFPEPQKSNTRTMLQRPRQDQLSIDTRQIVGHFIEHIQAVELNRREQGITHAVEFLKRCRVEAELFYSMIAAAQIDDSLGTALDAVSASIQHVLFNTRMPQWLKDASTDDLKDYVQVLNHYSFVRSSEYSFLSDIPRLNVFARQKIVNQLRIDFPDHYFDPDTLKVTLTKYVGTPVGVGQTPSFMPAATEVLTESLTQFALNHFSTVHGATLSVSSVDDSLASTTLTPEYIRGLIRMLDVGAKYHELLVQKLDSKAADYATRKSMFFKQWPALMIELALQKKLEGKLTAQAYDYVCGLMEMPDAIARQAVNDEEIVLCPLRLVATAGAEVDTVPGFYVIGPKDATQGPVVLYSIFNTQFCFKEYVDRQELLKDIQSSSSLQSQLMQRVSPAVQTRYGHHSFHIPPLWSVEFYVEYPMFSLAPVTLNYDPVEGNVLQYLFENAMDVLKDIAKQQTVTNKQADWESFTYLMSLGVEQSLIFLPGELGLLITAWQGVLLLQSSAASVASRDWGKALAEFTVALSIFASAKQAAKEHSKVEQDRSSEQSKLHTFVEFSWKNSQLPAEVKSRLQVFEASDISLDGLLRDDLYNLYNAPLTNKNYAAVAGRVYQVRKINDLWYIVRDEEVGPSLRLNARQQWELNLRWGLMGGGGGLTRFKSSSNTVKAIDRVVAQEFTVLASGMPTIRQLYRTQAVQIGRAHLQAKQYLETCLDNLNFESPNRALEPNVTRIIGDFFGVPTPKAELVVDIRRSVTKVFAALLDASLAPYSSLRYVTGLNKPSFESALAFTIKSDPLQRIFLSEQFFQVPPYQLKMPIPGTHFKMSSHYRAASVIHEVSHLSNNTFDIAYVESTAPFLDLMADHEPGLIRLKDDMKEIQKRFLSHQTPEVQLFKRFKNGRWEDLNDEVDEGKDFVLSATGTSILADARVQFLTDADKRAKVLLGNADSLTLLITLLGRVSFVV
jgi:hypothetical protein